jgi:GntR family transcriptional regulator / MocR family aminotransferase
LKAKKKGTVPILFSTILNQNVSLPLYRQLYEGLRQAILTGQLAAGTKLPSTRQISSDLRISRNTVIIAFEQLRAEEYLESRAKSGTYVTRLLPDELLEAPLVKEKSAFNQITKRPSPSLNSVSLPAAPATYLDTGHRPEAFRPGLPALDAFPLHIWSRLTAKRWRRLCAQELDYDTPAGYHPLRQAIADYVATVRGVRCTYEQVLIVSGSQQALDLTIRVLLHPGDAVWIEEPGSLSARSALQARGARVVPVPVDAEGLNVSAGRATEAIARFVYVSPSHQYPLGVTMSLARRLELLEWAKQSQAWILEDDYDSEYRFAGRPLEALQGLDWTGRVIYLGTFSKVLFPALRLGYLIVPETLVDHFVSARRLMDRHSPTLDQITLTDFLLEGHFARHIRRMRALYEQRHDLLVEKASQELGEWIELVKTSTGLHLVGRLREDLDDRKVAQLAAENGVDVPPLSVYHLKAPRQGGLLFGYGGVNEQKIEEGVQRLKRTMQQGRDR